MIKALHEMPKCYENWIVFCWFCFFFEGPLRFRLPLRKISEYFLAPALRSCSVKPWSSRPDRRQLLFASEPDFFELARWRVREAFPKAHVLVCSVSWWFCVCCDHELLTDLIPLFLSHTSCDVIYYSNSNSTPRFTSRNIYPGRREIPEICQINYMLLLLETEFYSIVV